MRRASSVVRSGTGPSFLSTGCGNRAWYLHHSAAVCATLKFTSVIYSEKSSHLHSVREWHHFFAPKCIPFESGTTFTSHLASQPIQPSQPAASQPAQPAQPASSGSPASPASQPSKPSQPARRVEMKPCLSEGFARMTADPFPPSQPHSQSPSLVVRSWARVTLVYNKATRLKVALCISTPAQAGAAHFLNQRLQGQSKE